MSRIKFDIGGNGAGEERRNRLDQMQLFWLAMTGMAAVMRGMVGPAGFEPATKGL